MAGFHFFNSLGRKIEAFLPLEPGKVKLYACGPTVYKDSHIGNFRTYIFVDVLRRSLELSGLEVLHVMNITDVGHLSDDGDEGEDKMVREARSRGMDVWSIAKHFTDRFFEDFAMLNLKQPAVVCKATEHIPEMIAMVQLLEAKGYAYQSGGNVYFDVAKFPDYHKLALLEGVELQSSERAVLDEKKRNPQDFVLWFTNSKFSNQSMQWDSPWGRGYPGWHLECSAMSIKYLGPQFDIHCGGVDLIPTHHSNEIAQSEAATGLSPWVRHWMHGEFLLTGKDKMSKSSGNYLSVRSLQEQGWEPLDFRFLCFSAGYRIQLSFTSQAMDGARNSRKNLTRATRQLMSDGGLSASDIVPDLDLAPQGVRFLEELMTDLNTPRAMAQVWELLKSDHPPAIKLSVLAAMDSVLGLNLLEEPQQPQTSTPKFILDLVEERNQAKKQRDFTRADQIRAEVLAAGFQIIDTPQGPQVNPVESL